MYVVAGATRNTGRRLAVNVSSTRQPKAVRGRVHLCEVLTVKWSMARLDRLSRTEQGRIMQQETVREKYEGIARRALEDAERALQLSTAQRSTGKISKEFSKTLRDEAGVWAQIAHAAALLASIQDV